MRLRRFVSGSLFHTHCIRYNTEVLSLADRVACWTFLADGFLTVCFKNHPQLTIFEMDCDFPWSTELFEAENVSLFNDVVATQTTGQSLPTLRKVAESLLQMPSLNNRISWDRSLSVEHFLMLIYGMHHLLLIHIDSNIQ